MKIYFLVLMLSLFSGAVFAENSCQDLFLESKPAYQFTNGHNVPLQKIMMQIKKHDEDMREFTQRLRDEPSFKTPENLTIVLESSEKLKIIFNYLIEHAKSSMMTPRIEMKSAEQIPAFVTKYQQAYQEYALLVDQFIDELKRLQSLPPDQWTHKTLDNLLMSMHASMGASHNRF